jgi:4-hydroxy-2-oxoheptanedioate aldolase
LLLWLLGTFSPLIADENVSGRTGAGVRLNKAIEFLEGGKPVFGIFTYGLLPRNAAALSRSKLDFVMVDMEHGPLDFAGLQSFLLSMVDKQRILEKGNLQPDVVPLVRVPQNGRESLEFLVKQTLDVGAFGVMLPHVETADEALAAVRSARYAQDRGVADAEPAGQRGASYGYAAHVWGLPPLTYLQRADVWPLDARGELLLVVQIETKRGVENADEILSVPGVGAVFVGPRDLRHSLGVESDDPELEEAIQAVLTVAKARGIPCGITATAETVEQRVKEGFLFITLGNDAGVSFSAGVGLQAAHRAVGREP